MEPDVSISFTIITRSERLHHQIRLDGRRVTLSEFIGFMEKTLREQFAGRNYSTHSFEQRCYDALDQMKLIKDSHQANVCDEILACQSMKDEKMLETASRDFPAAGSGGGCGSEGVVHPVKRSHTLSYCKSHPKYYARFRNYNRRYSCAVCFLLNDRVDLELHKMCEVDSFDMKRYVSYLNELKGLKICTFWLVSKYVVTENDLDLLVFNRTTKHKVFRKMVVKAPGLVGDEPLLHQFIGELNVMISEASNIVSNEELNCAFVEFEDLDSVFDTLFAAHHCSLLPRFKS